MCYKWSSYCVTVYYKGRGYIGDVTRCMRYGLDLFQESPSTMCVHAGVMKRPLVPAVKGSTRISLMPLVIHDNNHNNNV